MDPEIEESTEQQDLSEQSDLVPAHEVTDGEPISPFADNGLPYPYSRGVFRAKLE